MTTESTPLPRTLAAILYADVVGFSRMTEADEDATYRRLKHFLGVFTTRIERHGGLVMNYAGDAILAMFGSAVDALICAANTQRYLAELNQDLGDDEKIVFRIGLNLGDVIEDRNDMFGDGVNIAARLESIAEPGGICISGSVYDSLGQKLPFDYEFMGEQHVKNISKPVRAYHAKLKPDAVIPDINPGRIILPRKDKKPVRKSRLVPGLITAGLFVLVAAMALNYYREFRKQQESVVSEPAGIVRQVPETGAVKAADAITDAPALAVLPFVNLSNSEAQEYFVDGMTDDLITDLSKISGLLVIARTSAFQYKGVSKDVRDISKELGVRYIIEGSARKVGQQVRINAQLIDATTGNHLWAERYDGSITDIFGLQDSIIGEIAGALQIQLKEKESAIVHRMMTDSIDAYDAYLLGKERFFTPSRDNVVKAREYFRKAATADPDFAEAHAFEAWTHVFAYMNGWSKTPEVSLENAIHKANDAIALNKELPLAYFVGGLATREQGDWEGALGHLEKAIELDPNYANAYVLLSSLLYYDGRPREGLERIQKAIRLEPFHPYNYPFHLGQAYFILKQYDKAVETFRRALDRNPEVTRTRAWLAASLAGAGMQDDAEWEAELLMENDPDFSLERFLKAFPFRNQPDREHFASSLLAAGLQ